MELHEITHIGVLGAGLMGHGIAQVFASAGYDVNIYDVDPATLRSGQRPDRSQLQGLHRVEPRQTRGH